MKLVSLVRIVVGCFLLFSTSACAKDLSAKLAQGTAAPGFTLQDESGKSVSLSDFKGKYVVLEWTNPDCPFVKRHYKEQTMQSLSSKYRKDGVVWLAVNSTHYMDAAKNQDWKASQEIPYPILIDQDGTVGKLYGAKTTPHMFIVGPGGALLYQGAIDDDAYGSSQPAERTLYVDQVLSALLASKEEYAQKTTPYGCSVKYSS